MNPLEVLNRLRANVPSPVQRFAGQVWNKIPTAINPFKTRQPTTALGRLGKGFNPLNPANALSIAATEAAMAIAGKTLPPEDRARVEYMTLGPKIGLFLNALDAGSAGVSPERERQLIEESERYFAQRSQPGGMQAAPTTRGPRVDTSTTQAQFYTPTPQQSARVVPVVAAAPPTPRPLSTQVLEAAKSEFAAPTGVSLSDFYQAQEQLGREMVASGALQQRMQETNLTGDALAEWARANPALAYREIIKRQKQPIPSVD